MTLPPEAFTIAVYAQPIFFILLGMVKRDSALLKRLFPPLWMVFVGLVTPWVMNLLNVSLYSLDLVFLYGFFVLVTYYIVAIEKGWILTEALSFTFLFVFFSSYFWELPIHLIGLWEHGLNVSVVLQATHAIPLFVFAQQFSIENGSRLTDLVLLSFLVTSVFTWIRFSSVVLENPSEIGLLHLNRVLCFALLSYIFLSDKILARKEMRNNT